MISAEDYNIKGEGHPKPKLSMFCTLFQNYQHFLNKLFKHPKLSGKLKNDIKIFL